MCKKGLSVLVLLSLWMCLTGFASLGEEGKDTWNSMMEQLSAEEIDQLLAEENEWYGKVMANVEDSVTIRAEASSDSAAVGKMFKGDAGEILEQQEGWTRIQSGDVDGWVSDEYLAFGKDAEERAEEDVKKIATVTADGLKVRDEASTDSPVIDLIGHGEQIEVGEDEDGWLQIIYSDGEMDYVSADYVEVSYNYGEAKTMEQIEAEEAARRAEEEKAKRTKNLGAIAASTDEVTLLAALIQSESGNQPYEGQLGVGAVVMNRVRSGSYPNTIPGSNLSTGTVWTGGYWKSVSDSGQWSEGKLYAGSTGSYQWRDHHWNGNSFQKCVFRYAGNRDRKSRILVKRIYRGRGWN